ncbi:MAG: hypothetical protein ACW981_05135 [Candidatus Hodarchaeales archaeon]|jgi:radical SAM superfamily enzyme with C-terminal helix-hairpin-helix motif
MIKGFPKLLLLGLNFSSGLHGETKKTFKSNFNFLKSIFDEGLLLRRINLRQMAGLQQDFRPEKYMRYFFGIKKEFVKK